MNFKLGHRPEFDGLRGVSILLVLSVHLRLIAPRLSQMLPSGGFLGVDVFFVISGFLITALLLDEHVRCGGISLRSFYWRRALRLLPALAGILIFTGIMAASLGSLSAPGLTPLRVASVFGYFTNWVRAYEPPQTWFLFHFWSLSIEEQFYIVWPAVLLLLLRLKRHHALYLVVIAISASAALKIILYLTGATTTRIYYGSDTRADSILIGCAGAMLLTFGYARTVRAIGSLAPAAAIILAAFVYLSSDGFKPLYLGGFTLVAMCVLSVILYAVSTPTSKAVHLLSGSALVWIGKRSYGLYLWHWPMFEIARLMPSELLIMPLACILTFAAATLSFRFIEQPFLRLKGRYRSRRESQPLRPRRELSLAE